MTYNKNEILRKILKQFLDNRIISLKNYLDMLSNLDNCQLVEDFLMDCINKFNIDYVNYPEDYLEDLVFLKKICAVRPKVIKEIKKHNITVYNLLFTNLSVKDTEIAKQFPERKRGLIKLEKVC